MALQRQVITVNFTQGVESKVDPFQLPPTKFLSLVNIIWNKDGMLSKRLGFAALSSLSGTTATYVTTFMGNLLALGTQVEAYIEGTSSWQNQGSLLNLTLTTQSVVKKNTNQNQMDTAIASNGLACTVYNDVPPGGALTITYTVTDTTTGQSVVAPVAISGAIGFARIYILGVYFFIVYQSALASLSYTAIPIATPSSPLAPVVITTNYLVGGTVAAAPNFDGVLVGGVLQFAFGSTTSNIVRILTISPTLVISAPSNLNVVSSIDTITVCASGNFVIVFYFISGLAIRYQAVVANTFVLSKSETLLTGVFAVVNLTSVAYTGANGHIYGTVIAEVSNAYSYGSQKTNLLKINYVEYNGSTWSNSSFATALRSVGLASKPVATGTSIYYLGYYGSSLQPTYFLLSTPQAATTATFVSKLAYSNGGLTYATTLSNGLPTATLSGSTIIIPYLTKTTLIPINKAIGSNNTTASYSTVGINLITYTLGGTISTGEIAKGLHISGGFLALYGGLNPVEHGFFVWPDNLNATPSTTGGTIGGGTAGDIYYYVATYEWSDYQGNIHRSAPSLPLTVDLSSATYNANTNSVVLDIPTLRLTYKTVNPVKLVLYRYSVDQPIYYQVTSVSSPTLNSLTVDSLQITDTLPDSSIIGDNILYTTGGVIENIASPSTSIVTLFDSRLWLVNAEDTNELWYSKQVLQATPVEMSDLLTYYVSPTPSAQTNSGGVTAQSPMDDKLILFKRSTIYYINGNGPDDTGTNGQYSPTPIFIVSPVGCTNQNSITLIPQGLMFQSNTGGIWIVKRNLEISYIGAPAEVYTQAYTVKSAVTIPGTTQVRFTMSSGIFLYYDYFFDRWTTTTALSAISSTIYTSLHTYITATGTVGRESGAYLDGATPVVISLTTAWINLAGIQGLERIYYMLLLGAYITPFTLTAQIGYNYNSASETITVSPDNTNNIYGDTSTVLRARIFPSRQKVESIQLTLTEVYNSSYGISAGAGFTLSGISFLAGIKKGVRTQRANQSFG